MPNPSQRSTATVMMKKPHRNHSQSDQGQTFTTCRHQMQAMSGWMTRIAASSAYSEINSVQQTQAMLAGNVAAARLHAV